MIGIFPIFFSIKKGRSYLASNYELIKTIHGALKIEKDDTLTKQHLLAALQKLSLRFAF